MHASELLCIVLYIGPTSGKTSGPYGPDMSPISTQFRKGAKNIP